MTELQTVLAFADVHWWRFAVGAGLYLLATIIFGSGSFWNEAVSVAVYVLFWPLPLLIILGGVLRNIFNPAPRHTRRH